jgi:magnesium transporter
MIYNFNTIDSDCNEESIHMDKKQLFQIIKSLERRDFYIIDKTNNFRISSIVAKKDSILIKLDYIRCIITSSKAYFVLLDETYQDSMKKLNKKIIDDIQSKDDVKTCVNPFEFIVLESILAFMSDMFDNEIDKLSPQISQINRCINDADFKINKTFTDILQRVMSLRFRIKDIYDLLKDISEWNNEEFNHFYLSIDKTDTCDEISQIINNYEKQVEENKDDIEKMEEGLRTRLQILNIGYAATRNDIARLEIKLTMFTVGVTTATLIPSILGMNIVNELEDSNNSFYVIIGSICLITVSIYLLLKKRFDII